MPDRPNSRLDLATRHFFTTVALGGIALIGYFGTKYGWPSVSDVAARYGISLVIATFGIYGRLLSPQRRAALVLLCLALGGSLLLAEWLIDRQEAIETLRLRERVEQATGIPYDARSIPEVVHELRAAGIRAVPSIVSKVILPATEAGAPRAAAFSGSLIPFAGVSNALTVQLCNEDGRHFTYESDRFGFSNPDPVWDSPAPHLVLIGDSFVHGYCVDSDSTLPAWIRRVWPQTLNLGTGGSGPLGELAVLTEYGPSADPAILLWVYYENDLDDLARERGSAAATHYLEAGHRQGLATNQPAIDSSLSAWIESQYATHHPVDPLKVDRSFADFVKLRGIRGLLVRTRQGATRSPEEELPLFTQVLGDVKARSDAMGAETVFVFLPSWERCFRPSAIPHDAARSEVLNAARDVGLPIIDLTPKFRSFARPEMLFARRDIASAHYSAIGYGFAASWILEGLDSLGLWPPPVSGAERGANATPMTPDPFGLGLQTPESRGAAKCLDR